MAMDRNAMLLAATVLLYLIIIVLGFPQSTGMGLAVSRLQGCPLFPEFTPIGPLFGTIQNCNYVTYMPVIVSLIYGIAQFIYHLYLLVKAVRYPEIRQQGGNLAPVIGLTAVGLILTLIGAGLTTGGLYYFCQSNRELAVRFFGRPLTCVAGELGTPLLFRGYDPYYDLIGTEVAYWLSVIAWLALLIVTILRMVNIRRDPNNTGAGRPGEATLQGVTLLPDRFRSKVGKYVETSPSSGGQERTTTMSQFETKIKPLETAA